ncbi:MAG TPA: potassium channel protein [Acetobacteraceae bacterium]|nr:potassium channel protein [Acetobacteraceae bacterium]
MRGALSSPLRNLLGGMLFVLGVMAVSVIAYVQDGWNIGDAIYMVVLTVFTVGYDEVHPIDTVQLRVITIGLIWFGCTGMIFVTGALIQFITATQFSDMLDKRRMTSRIDQLTGHVIICGFGRIGRMLASELRAAGEAFVLLERNEERIAEAQEAGFLCLRADATEEPALLRARIEHARALATVLPDDAANVFITLSARNLNRNLTIIARGEATSTEQKLMHAGADRVVSPAHIGAERIAEILLFPKVADTMDEQRGPGGGIRKLGLASEVVIAAAHSPWIGLTVREIERRADATFVIVELERAGTRRVERVRDDTRVAAGDGVLVIGRSTSAAVQGFGAER